MKWGETIKKLGEKPNPEEVDWNQKLFEACIKGDFALAEEAIKNGADVNAKDKYGSTPLIRIMSESANEKIVELLLNSGAKVDEQDEDKQTALMKAAFFGFKNKENVKLLIKAGANLNLKDEFGRTALIFAAENGYKEIVETFVEAGADVNIKGERGWTALMLAAENGHKEIVNILIKAGADVYAKDDAEKTAIDHAKDAEIKEILSKAVVMNKEIFSKALTELGKSKNNETKVVIQEFTPYKREEKEQDKGKIKNL